MEFEKRRRCTKAMNMAPLIDVVFLLLLFFMLTSQFIEEPAIKIALPKSKTSEVLPNEEPKTISVTEAGQIYFMGSMVELKDLKTAILQTQEQDFIKIKADSGVRLGLMVNVIDEVKLAGIKQFSIAAQPQQSRKD
jgi:biopolymer transport protein ExbD